MGNTAENIIKTCCKDFKKHDFMIKLGYRINRSLLIKSITVMHLILPNCALVRSMCIKNARSAQKWQKSENTAYGSTSFIWVFK